MLYMYIMTRLVLYTVVYQKLVCEKLSSKEYPKNIIALTLHLIIGLEYC